MDPFLLYDSENAVYKDLHEEIITYLCFLRDRAVAGELTSGSVMQWLLFKEVKQNWLGFLLAPSVYRKLDGTQFDVRNLYNYRLVTERNIITHSVQENVPVQENVFAFAFNNETVNGANPLLSAIRRMKRSVPKKYHEKYANTEKFILKHALRRTTSTAT